MSSLVLKETMSRIGRQPIQITQGISVQVKGDTVSVSGPRGDLKLQIKPEVEVLADKQTVLIKKKSDSKVGRSLHGLYRSLIANMVKGVSDGWDKTLKLVGTGYRVKKIGDKLEISLGFSHPVIVEPVKGIDFEIQGNDTIKVSGIDKALVGQVAAKIRQLRPPEPYKGKGIRYEGEEVRRKPGKAAKVGAAFGAGE